MIRINLGGKVAYLKTIEKASEFVKNILEKEDFENLLKDTLPSVEYIQKDFKKLIMLNTKLLIGRKMFYKNNLGISVANYYMGFKNKLNVEDGLSVEENLKKNSKIIIKKIIFLEKNNNINTSNLITSAEIIGGGQRLSNFMPSVAKSIYEFFIPKYNANILDMSAGFGGRLTGAMSSKFMYYYTGVDPSTKACEGLNNLIYFLNVKDRAKIINLPFEDSENYLDKEYDFAFTSPPYFKKEHYSDEPTQSYLRYPEIEIWVENFLKKSFEIVKRKLKPKSLMVINIADVKIKNKKFGLEDLTIETAKSVGFKYLGRKLMEMSRIPGLNKKYKSEPLFIFEKT
jgi:16S rRNA G966 N2-methylase RsmD